MPIKENAPPLIPSYQHECRIKALHSVIKSVFNGEALIVTFTGYTDPAFARLLYNDCRVDVFCTGDNEKGINVDFDVFGPDNRKFTEVNHIHVPRVDIGKFGLSDEESEKLRNQIELEQTNATAIYENPEK